MSTFKRMSFRLRDTLTIFQHCMMSIFFNIVEDMIEVIMDDFLVVGDPLDDCLTHLSDVLKHYEECNLVLN